MSKTHIIGLSKKWWAEERAPSSAPVQIVDRSKPVRVSKVFHTVKQVAERFQVSGDVVYALCQSGELEANRFGRCWRISEEALQDYLSRPRAG